MEKEQVEHRNKLEEIADRVAEDRQVCEAMDFTLDRTAQDRQDLMDIVSAAYGLVDTFRGYARNIRYNNRENRTDWEDRAKGYETAAAEVAAGLERAVAKL
jgi:hypothetical protein